MQTNLKHRQFGYGLLLLSMIWLASSLVFSPSTLPDIQPSTWDDQDDLPNFSEFENTKLKKEAFFDYLFPIIVDENLFVLKIRHQLENLQQKQKLQSLSDEELTWIHELKQDYLVESEDIDEVFTILLRRVNIIPPSLVLAQAAIESGWGTSRFAIKGNNLFGHWCFESGCGMVPKNRPAHLSHEVAEFDSVNESIRSYLKNLNTFHLYQDFRHLRKQTNINETGKGVLKLLPGLEPYSEQGDVYLRKVTRMIKQNKLQRFDSLFIEQLNQNINE